MDRLERRRAEQTARLFAAEAETFAHYGVEATSEPLVLDDPAVTTRVVRLGEGPPVVLFHGATLTSTAWAPLLPHLPGRTLHLVDLPGCGPTEPFDYRGVDLAGHQTAFVGAVLDVLALDRPALIGASMGGWFALRFAVERPDRIGALALITAPALALPGAKVPLPMAMSSGHVGRRLAAATPAPSGKVMRRMLATIGGDGSVTGVPDALFDALGAATALAVPSSTALDLHRRRVPHPHLQVDEAALTACPVPTLLLWGEDDKVQPPEAGAWAAALLPEGRLEVLPGGHGLWFDHPERCGRVLTSFLDAVA